MIIPFSMLEQAWKDTVPQNSEEINKAKFKYFLCFNLFSLEQELETNTYLPRPLRTEKIWAPKPREVQVPAIRDKIVQHAICDNYLNKRLTKPLIKETSACLELRGTGYASDILKQHMFNYYKNNGTKFYVLKCDISKYFASIPHDNLYKLIDRYVDDKNIVCLMHKFIDQLPVGLALGLQQSQLLANLYLSSLDHFCKEFLLAKYYGRYMDDFYIISDNAGYLEYCLFEIESFVNSIGLQLNPKTAIFKNKLEFIGFTYHIADGGKIVKLLNQKKKSSKRRHIKKMLNDVHSGRMSTWSLVEKYAGWRVHALRGNCYKLVAEWDAFIIDEMHHFGYTLKFDDKRWEMKRCHEQLGKSKTELGYS